MNSALESFVHKMGCICSKKSVNINSRKYNVREHLGEGGFSTVELVQDVVTQKYYALKIIVCHGSEDQNIALLEVKHHSLLKHPNVIECIASEVTGHPDPLLNTTSQVLLLLPYYKKGTLAQNLEMRSVHKMPMKQLEVMTMFLQICEGVKAFHEASPVPLAHRDLKTANILLTDDNIPIIMDLGSVTEAQVKVCGQSEAQALQDIASERCSMTYRAPELFNVQSYCMIDERTDIWSLGCILYAMCYFKSPFDASHERGDSVALAVISRVVEFPATSSFHSDMHMFILWMLDVNPIERPSIYSVISKAQDLLTEFESSPSDALA